MRFYNSTVTISTINTPYSVLANSDNEKSAIIITLQIINNNQDIVTVTFRRRDNSTKQYTEYVSNIKVKNGTTVLDHLMVIQSNCQYTAQSNKNGVIISCSYGI